MHRRAFLQAATLIGISTSGAAGTQNASRPKFEPWKPGMLDIHHLAYGRGNCTFVLCPDATSILIDAGTTEDTLDVSSAQKPNATVRPGQWIASYVQRHLRAAGREELDYFLLTHIHPDHLGDLGPENPRSPKGDYRLTGVMDVDALLRIGKVIDRGFPDYQFPGPQQAAFALNYLKFMQSRVQMRESCERFVVGSAKQIRLMRNPQQYVGFVVQNLAANGEVWTGEDEVKTNHFPSLTGLQPADLPTENMCSLAIRMSFGKFDYFTGGDLTCDTEETGESWRDIETAVAEASGPVEVAVANHHGYFDAVGPNFVRLLRPRVFVVPSWYVAHPSILPLRRMLSQHLYQGNRDVFATSVMKANRSVNNQYLSNLKSLDGHVIVRVADGGDTFRVVVADNNDDSDRVMGTFGPYRCL